MAKTVRVEVIRPMIQGKIHRARVTDTDLHYVGSVTIDKGLLDVANIVEGQRVDIADIDNGRRLSTYMIAGPRGSDVVQPNGAAARLVSVGGLVIIMAYYQVLESQVRGWKSAVTLVDEHNHIIETGDSTGHISKKSERARELGLKSAGKP